MSVSFLYGTLPAFKITDERLAVLHGLVDKQEIETDDPESAESWRKSAHAYLDNFATFAASNDTCTIQQESARYAQWISGGYDCGIPDAAEAFIHLAESPLLWCQMRKWALGLQYPPAPRQEDELFSL